MHTQIVVVYMIFQIPFIDPIKYVTISSFVTLAGPKRRTQKVRSGTRVPNAGGLIVALNPSEPCRSFFCPPEKEFANYITKVFLTISWWLHPPFEPVGALNPFFWPKKGFRPNLICEKEVSPKAIGKTPRKCTVKLGSNVSYTRRVESCLDGWIISQKPDQPGSLAEVSWWVNLMNHGFLEKRIRQNAVPERKFLKRAFRTPERTEGTC